LNLAIQWITECLESHPTCKSRHRNAGPTRVLEIIPSEDPQKCDLQLLEKPNTAEPYIAVSHCWGEADAPPLCTTTQSLKGHLQRIKFEKLPKSFQDATIVASTLGVKRLWIDSLCIVQDDSADWQKECPLMADIYAGALITIAASNAPNSHAGFLNDYPSDLRCSLGPSIQIRSFPTRSSFPSTSPMFLNEESILSSRGWTLQESIFSTRLLSFKRERMQWHCGRESRSDDVLEPYQSQFEDQGLERPTVTKLAIRDGPYVYKSWRVVVQNFSRRDLTKHTDKLPAMSGLARFICERLGDRYAAGVFIKDAWNCLCWRVVRPDEIPCSQGFANEFGISTDQSQPTPFHTPVIYRAPSWSWVSTNGEVQFNCINIPDLVILDCQVIMKGHDPFGEVSDGFIQVHGFLKKMPLGNFCSRKKYWGFGQIIIDDTLSHAAYDTCRTFSVSPIILLLLGYGEYKLSMKGTSHPTAWQLSETVDEKSMWKREWYALVVEQICDKGPNYYRRIGLAIGEDCNEAAWFDNCVRQTVTIL
jgi:hypothetical protein